MSRLLKGNHFERTSSRRIHAQGTALLIDPAFLRRRGLGQVDLARIRGARLEIYELKSSAIGYLSATQRKRLHQSANFLAKLLAKEVTCRLLTKQLNVAF